MQSLLIKQSRWHELICVLWYFFRLQPFTANLLGLLFYLGIGCKPWLIEQIRILKSLSFSTRHELEAPAEGHTSVALATFIVVICFSWEHLMECVVLWMRFSFVSLLSASVAMTEHITSAVEPLNILSSHQQVLVAVGKTLHCNFSAHATPCVCQHVQM